MKVKLSSGNRITIPKSLIDELNLNRGMVLDAYIECGKLIIQQCEKSSDSCNNTYNEKQLTIENNDLKRKIKPNLEEGKNYKKKYYTDCELVIRTKRKYLNQFCEDCKGLLIKQGYNDNHKCPYIYNNLKDIKEHEVKVVEKQTISKCIISELTKNINTLDSKLQQEIDVINNVPEAKDFSRSNNTTIFPVTLRQPRQCCGCDEFHTNGFIIDDIDFYCKLCAVKDFKKFLNNGGK